MQYTEYRDLTVTGDDEVPVLSVLTDEFVQAQVERFRVHLAAAAIEFDPESVSAQIIADEDSALGVTGLLRYRLALSADISIPVPPPRSDEGV